MNSTALAAAAVSADESRAVSSALAAFMKQGAAQAQAMAEILEQASEAAKAMSADGVGSRVDLQA